MSELETTSSPKHRRPLLSSPDIPQWFIANPPDWSKNAENFVARVIASPAEGAALVHPHTGEVDVVTLSRLLRETPNIESIEGVGGSYVLDLKGATASGVLFLYLAPYRNEPRVVGWEYRVRA